uniref:Uncharacterized protein n=1 Tax=Arundo donax TaxID=35708 RepID=A0A0A9BHZ6_ARUDO
MHKKYYRSRKNVKLTLLHLYAVDLCSSTTCIGDF